MKRAPLIAAVVAIILLLGDAAPAALRTRRSTRNSDEEDTNRTVTYTSGNVRSTPRAVTHNRSERRPTTRSVSNVTFTSGNVRSSSRSTTRTRHTPSTTTRRTTTTRRQTPTYRRETTTMRRDRHNATHTRTIGNVRHGTGNVTYCYCTEPDTDRPHRLDPPDRERHLGFYPCPQGSHSRFFSWDSNAFICIHDGPTAPYWYRGRWHRLTRGHTHRTGCGRALYYGYWIDVRDRYYVEQIEPPWVTHTVTVQYEDDDSEFIPKAQVLDTVRVKALVLSTAERVRVETLIQRGILRDILDENDPYGEFSYDYDPRISRLTLTAPAERIAVIETIVLDRRTFAAFTEPDRYGNTAAVVPLVSPFFLEQDARAAIRLASDNFNAMRRLLEDRDRDPLYTAHGKTCWLNPECGTATLLNEPDAIERAAQFMDTRPFVPRDLVSP